MIRPAGLSVVALLVAAGMAHAQGGTTWRNARREQGANRTDWRKHRRNIRRLAPGKVGVAAVCTQGAGTCTDCVCEMIEQSMVWQLDKTLDELGVRAARLSADERNRFTEVFAREASAADGRVHSLPTQVGSICHDRDIHYIAVFHRVKARSQSDRAVNVTLGSVPGDPNRFPEYRDYVVEVGVSVYEVSSGMAIHSASEQETDRIIADGAASAVEELLEDLAEEIGWD